MRPYTAALPNCNAILDTYLSIHENGEFDRRFFPVQFRRFSLPYIYPGRGEGKGEERKGLGREWKGLGREGRGREGTGRRKVGQRGRTGEG